MWEILRTLPEKHVTPTREMTLVLARCCRCGATARILEQNVRRSNRESRDHCPTCLPETFHRMTRQRPYRIWKGLVSRVTDETDPDFKNYGARGLTVDPGWLDFRGFWRDMRRGYSDELTIERIDNMKGYCRGNCRWATNAEQQSNKRSTRVVEYRGSRMHLAEFCRLLGVHRGAITPYLDRYLTGDRAIAEYLKSPYPQGRRSRARSSTS